MAKKPLFPEKVNKYSTLEVACEQNGWVVHVNVRGERDSGMITPRYVFVDDSALSSFVKLFAQAQQDEHWHDGV